eukprot:569494_1
MAPVCNVFVFICVACIHLQTCYYFHNDALPWKEAEAYCHSECDSHLVSIHSTTQQQDIAHQLDAFGNPDVWIGLNLSASAWTDGTAYDYGTTPFQFPWFMDDNPSGDGSCIEIISRSWEPEYASTWNDALCDDTQSFLCASCNFTVATSPFYLSPTRFEFQNARRYCQNHCQSDLASIHDSAQNDLAVYLAATGPRLGDYLENSNFDWQGPHNVFIGLHQLPGSTPEGTSRDYYWVDGTPFDYGNVAAFSEEGPWGCAEPDYENDEQCTVMHYTGVCNTWAWGDEALCNDLSMRFLCNSCGGSLNKYAVVHRTPQQYADAETYCETYLGTTLASIHSKYDYDSAVRLCAFANNETHVQTTGNGGCYIGLEERDVEDVFAWTDGSDFDFANDFASDLWAPDNSNQKNVDCVALSYDHGYKLDTINCRTDSMFICNLPSLLCESWNWQSVIGNHALSNCELISDALDLNDNIMIATKQWMNDNNKLMIEYTFKFMSVSDGTAGIMIFNTSEAILCDYYYIAIHPISRTLVVSRTVSANDMILVSVPITSSIVEYYVLQITIDGGNMAIVLNGDTINTINTEMKNVVLSGHIAIRNQNTKTLSKSVYVSGAMMDVSNTLRLSQYVSCADTSTSNPSYTPTWTPLSNTIALSSDPSASPSSNPTLNPISNQTPHPSSNPTLHPTLNPSASPSSNPTLNPISNQTPHPSLNPTLNPSLNPTLHPTLNPTLNPSLNPTSHPTLNPIHPAPFDPTSNPTVHSSLNPTLQPTFDPTLIPMSFDQTLNPTEMTYGASTVFLGGSLSTVLSTAGPVSANDTTSDLIAVLVVLGVCVITLCLCGAILMVLWKIYTNRQKRKWTNAMENEIKMQPNETVKFDEPVRRLSVLDEVEGVGGLEMQKTSTVKEQNEMESPQQTAGYIVDYEKEYQQYENEENQMISPLQKAGYIGDYGMVNQQYGNEQNQTVPHAQTAGYIDEHLNNVIGEYDVDVDAIDIHDEGDVANDEGDDDDDALMDGIVNDINAMETIR